MTTKKQIDPLIDLAGWDEIDDQPDSLDGQQPLPGMESAEAERARRRILRSLTAKERRAESEGQQHLF